MLNYRGDTLNHSLNTMKPKTLLNVVSACLRVVCVHSHLSWGALLYRFDDGNSVSLFQRKAVASVIGPYLEEEKKHVFHQKNPKPAD